MVDGLNRRVPAEEQGKQFAPVRAAYHGLQADKHLLVEEAGSTSRPAARWVVDRLWRD
jgi:hypothetical protein